MAGKKVGALQTLLRTVTRLLDGDTLQIHTTSDESGEKVTEIRWVREGEDEIEEGSFGARPVNQEREIKRLIRMAKEASEEEQTPRPPCAAKTRRGLPCSRSAATDSRYCRQHSHLI